MPDIKGYRELTADELAAVNHLKTIEEDLGQTFRTLIDVHPRLGGELDPRWLAIAKTHFQEGFMALVRSVTRPEDWF